MNTMHAYCSSLIKKKRDMVNKLESFNEYDYLDQMDDDEVEECLITHVPFIRLAKG